MLLILKQYILDLAKESKKFDKNRFSEFLYLWPDLDEYIDKIFDCLQ